MIKDAKITVIIKTIVDLQKLDNINTKQGINVVQISGDSSLDDTGPSVFEISGSFEAILEVSKLFGVKQNKQWLFVRKISDGSPIILCASIKEFEKMIAKTYYNQYEYKFAEIINIELMTFSDKYLIKNDFTNEVEEIFKSDIDWKPIQKIIYWSDE